MMTMTTMMIIASKPSSNMINLNLAPFVAKKQNNFSNFLTYPKNEYEIGTSW